MQHVEINPQNLTHQQQVSADKIADTLSPRRHQYALATSPLRKAPVLWQVLTL